MTPKPVSLVHARRQAAQAARAAEAAKTAAARAELTAASKQALDTLKASSKLIPGLLTAVAIAGTAVANTPGMNDAKAGWNALAKLLEVAYPSVIGNAVFLSRADWQADDREEFLNATALFGGEMQKLSGVCYTMEGKLDAVRQAYYDYWKGIATLSGTVLLYALAARRMSLASPATATAAQLQLHRLGAITNGLVAKMTMLLGSYLALSGSALVSLIGAMGNMNNIMPTAGTKIDFRSVTISTRPPSAWIAPKREIPAPYDK
ncbi:hypothetical protein [Streptosporangium carneum]|uniref:Uncharacterized protein n=1 Tax=Streptosporangium carneum TaxID=47481 RepID=A0A9W6I8L0_9ACTN|nr:hypothetical protein [Streptosporangium carneum]GLK13608.1 hypothetical protein GCM10017600_70190 [Streptosporangium carneum]